MVLGMSPEPIWFTRSWTLAQRSLGLNFSLPPENDYTQEGRDQRGHLIVGEWPLVHVATPAPALGQKIIRLKFLSYF